MAFGLFEVINISNFINKKKKKKKIKTNDFFFPSSLIHTLSVLTFCWANVGIMFIRLFMIFIIFILSTEVGRIQHGPYNTHSSSGKLIYHRGICAFYFLWRLLLGTLLPTSPHTPTARTHSLSPSWPQGSVILIPLADFTGSVSSCLEGLFSLSMAAGRGAEEHCPRFGDIFFFIPQPVDHWSAGGGIIWPTADRMRQCVGPCCQAKTSLKLLPL
jgi:hypothetical protein